MKKIVADMIKIYKPIDKDWMNFKITKDNLLTFHHIVKKENGGLEEIDNGALLTKKAHDLLHCMEKHNVNVYNELNDIFKCIINEKKYPRTQLLMITKELILKYINNGYLVPKELKKKKIIKMMVYETFDH